MTWLEIRNADLRLDLNWKKNLLGPSSGMNHLQPTKLSNPNPKTSTPRPVWEGHRCISHYSIDKWKQKLYFGYLQVKSGVLFVPTLYHRGGNSLCLFLQVAKLPSISFREITSRIRVRKRGLSVKLLLVVLITHLLLATVMVLITTLQPITGILIENHSTVEVIVLAVVVGLLVRLLLNQRSLPLIILLWILWTLNASEGLYYEIKSWLNNCSGTT